MPTPGVNGLARSRQQTVTGPEWCVKAINAIVDDAGRLAAREGWVKQNATAITSSPNVVQLFEYVKGDQTVEVISSANLKLYKGVATLSDITGAITAPTGSNWQFGNLSGSLYGWQQAHTPIKWTGTGNFADCTAATGSLPTGNCGVAAFGRLWIADLDRQTIKYCALTDATKWDAADGGGAIDMRQVWTKGMDEVVAITSFGSNLVVFGKRHIIFWTDGAGSEIGLDPTQMYVNQVVEDVGLVARDAFTLLGELDVIFWSSNGVRSLARTVQEQATPVNQVSPENREYINAYLSTGTLANVRMAYNALYGFVLLSHPDAAKSFYFDTRSPLPDGSLRTFEWTLAPTALLFRLNNDFLLGMAGHIGLYDGYDDNDVAYRFTFNGGWVPLSPEPGLKMLKRAKVAIASRVAVVGTFKWWTDFKGNMQGVQREWVPPGGSLYNYLPDQYNYTAEYSGGGGVIDKYIPMRKSCSYIKIGYECVINGYPFALQYVTLMFEPTRYA
jgi:hypothetical protein